MNSKNRIVYLKSSHVRKSKKNPASYQYLQIVKNNKVKGKVNQWVTATIGQLDHLQQKGRVETLIRSPCRNSKKAMLMLTGQSDPNAVSIIR